MSNFIEIKAGEFQKGHMNIKCLKKSKRALRQAIGGLRWQEVGTGAWSCGSTEWTKTNIVCGESKRDLSEQTGKFFQARRVREKEVKCFTQN